MDQDAIISLVEQLVATIFRKVGTSAVVKSCTQHRIRLTLAEACPDCLALEHAGLPRDMISEVPT